MENYSVLMSVYKNDRPEWFRQAAESMLRQSFKPSQFVLVEDGPVPEKLEQTIKDTAASCDKDIRFDIIRLSENGGLGPALNEGLKHCQYDLVARMDADDVSLPDRCMLQTSYMTNHPQCAALSGTLLEFEGEIPGDYGACIKKSVPSAVEEIRKYAAVRNPVNHPCVMFRKSCVDKAGGYCSVPYFEDYDLWLRMLFDCGMEFSNLTDPLLLMRTDGMYERRGGIKYTGHMISFRRKMQKKGYIGLWKNLYITCSRVAVSLVPGSIRRLIYRKMLR